MTTQELKLVELKVAAECAFSVLPYFSRLTSGNIKWETGCLEVSVTTNYGAPIQGIAASLLYINAASQVRSMFPDERILITIYDESAYFGYDGLTCICSSLCL